MLIVLDGPRWNSLLRGDCLTPLPRDWQRVHSMLGRRAHPCRWPLDADLSFIQNLRHDVTVSQQQLLLEAIVWCFSLFTSGGYSLLIDDLTSVDGDVDFCLVTSRLFRWESDDNPAMMARYSFPIDQLLGWLACRCSHRHVIDPFWKCSRITECLLALVKKKRRWRLINCRLFGCRRSNRCVIDLRCKVFIPLSFTCVCLYKKRVTWIEDDGVHFYGNTLNLAAGREDNKWE